ncbi:TAT-variant-translocated molybdopterin oxidoreductase [Nibricoccus sp. IMCC34717]|uniref:TAT-variant-translocated molybdopterin oxidoreductase n=1 Tax=Nibricoccus sp. IMCC34717 TaxID=3034021 RepID=UPI00385023B1
MKRNVQHPEPSKSELTGPKYWRSLDELVESPGFREHVEREFPEGASSLEGVDRRKFFKLMAASFALGGVGLAAGCRRPEKHILPYGRSVEGVIPGLPLYFASAMPLRSGAIPILAETHQGRPTKIEGNPSYLPYGGATNALVQASVLDLYDPERATSHKLNGSDTTVAAIQDRLTEISTRYAATKGAGLAILADGSSSPTRARLAAQLKDKLPRAIFAEYEPVRDEPPAEAAAAVFGAAVKPVYRFAKAKRILSLDADFLQAESHSLAYTRDFAKGRRLTTTKDEMSRLYVAESTLTITGSMADHRLRLASSHMLALAGAIAAAVTGDTTFAKLAQGLDFANKEKWIAACAKDLREAGSGALVVAGAHQPAEVHAVAYAINVALGAVGSTIDFVAIEPRSSASIFELAAQIKSGAVKTLVVLGGNPAYNAPAELDWAALQASVSEVIRHGYSVDETSQGAQVHIGATHYLESWGDARTSDGTIVPVQPMIVPLFGGFTEIEVLARLAGVAAADPYSLVHETLAPLVSGDTEKGFRKFLHDGYLAGSEFKTKSVSLSSSGLARLLNAAPAVVAVDENAVEVRFTIDSKLDDGRFANNGWLHELPDPITKIAWDNAILVSPRLAKKLGIYPEGSALQVARVENAEYTRGKEKAYLIEVSVGGRKVVGPAHIQPGLSNYTVVLPLGYGRTVTGHVGRGQGHNFYGLRTGSAAVLTGAKVSKTEGRYLLANTQEHWSMEGRDIVREANYDEFQRNPGFVDSIGMESHSPAVYGGHATPENDNHLSREQRAALNASRAKETPRGNSLYEHPDLTGVHQWGMSIDLNTCTGCNACVIACQAENNIPIVGKDQVLRGREMHWIRLDRYYSDGRIDGNAFGGEGNKELPEDPQVVVQPIACMHCETAPCEIVCPVNATVHDDEGLNSMAYNRCIGTRYCANNCPYKVRRFNFMDWNKRQLDSLYLGPLGPSGMPELVKMVKNPDVTVRMRGVMEKCTFCVQRIQQAKIARKAKAGASPDVKIPDGTVRTACQQVCPAEAIVFGDISDPESAVSKAKAREQDYSLLGYLNIRPRTTYLGRVRNPNHEMPDYADLPLSRKEYEIKNHPAGHDHGGAHEKGAHPEGSDHGAKHDEHAANLVIKNGGLS